MSLKISLYKPKNHNKVVSLAYTLSVLSSIRLAKLAHFSQSNSKWPLTLDNTLPSNKY